jgi:hypothetical protein
MLNSSEIYPALIISYARPEGVRDLIESCVSNGVTEIFIAIDGPKSDALRSRQVSIFEVVKSFSHVPNLKLKVLKQQRNLGVGVGVISAIDWFFSEVECGHILEDDLRVSSGFFQFSRDCLTHLGQDSRVMMVSGTEITSLWKDENSVLWSNYPMIWGWSTWRDRWLEMREGLLMRKSLMTLNSLSPRNLFWSIGANRVLDGKVDTWDTPLAAEFVFRGWLSVIPPVNLVSNFGDDGNASHTQSNTLGLNLPIQNLPSGLEILNSKNLARIETYNKYLEKNIFRIRLKHLFLPIYSLLFDRFKYKIQHEPLRERLSSSSILRSQTH